MPFSVTRPTGSADTSFPGQEQVKHAAMADRRFAKRKALDVSTIMVIGC